MNACSGSPRPARLVAALAVAALYTAPAHAMLGQPLNGEHQTASMPSRHDQLDAPTIDVDAATSRDPRGTVIVQWALRGQAVFCVTWDGRYKPDFRQLLGPDLLELYAGGRAERGGWLRSATTLVDDLAVQSQGRLGGFFGSACLRSITPAGFPTAGFTAVTQE